MPADEEDAFRKCDSCAQREMHHGPCIGLEGEHREIVTTNHILVRATLARFESRVGPRVCGAANDGNALFADSNVGHWRRIGMGHAAHFGPLPREAMGGGQDMPGRDERAAASIADEHDGLVAFVAKMGVRLDARGPILGGAVRTGTEQHNDEQPEHDSSLHATRIKVWRRRTHERALARTFHQP